MRPTWLLDYQSNVYSQSGEDGILAAILERLPTDRWCVEFGAWDGRHLSNTRRLIEDGYSAVLIEGDRARFRALADNYAHHPGVITIPAYVGFNETDGLDSLLRTHAVTKDFDVLSIDIDGNDYHAWSAVKAFRPKVVCIEFNPTISNDVRFVQPADPTVHQGSSLAALVDLARDKGYELACCLTANAFFVDATHFPRLKISDNRPEILRTDTSAVAHIFFGYDGTVFLRGRRKLPWHGLVLNEARLQIVPAVFRHYPATFGRIRRRMFRLYRKLHRLFTGD